MAKQFDDFEHHLCHLYNIDGKNADELSQFFHLSVDEILRYLVFIKIIEEKYDATSTKPENKKYFFMNHTKKCIIRTNDLAMKNISKYLCITIKKHQWSITDDIELVDYNKDRLFVKSMMNDYFCNQPYWFKN